MEKIEHIAIMCKENEALAEFYKKTFGLVEVKRHASDSHPEHAVGIYLSDGHINLALLPLHPGAQEGINHFGFRVRDAAATREAAVSLGAEPGSDDLPRDGRFAEGYIVDPAGTRVDLSVSGWDTDLP